MCNACGGWLCAAVLSVVHACVNVFAWQLEAELSAQRDAETALKSKLDATVMEREQLMQSILESQEAAAAEAQARANIEAELNKQVCVLLSL